LVKINATSIENIVILQRNVNFRPMKVKSFYVAIIVLISLFSCSEEEYEYYNLATPVVMSLDEVRKSIEILPPKEIKESGKIYSYKNLVFVNDKNKGVHIIDNRLPKNPKKISYINIPGNMDVSVKDDMLYANSFVDLVVFDISNFEAIKKVTVLENVFPFDYAVPENADAINWQALNGNSFPVDWVITREKKLIEEYNGDVVFNDVMTTAEASSVGQGGSMARFKIVSNYLYVVDFHNINIFDIQNLANPTKLQSVFAGFDIETIFNKDNNLFLGSRSGMYVYDIAEPSKPTFVSEFQHGTACDPVVVDDNYAYITLRAGNFCGAFESSLQIVDISDIKNPVLEKSYKMDGPYGLGIKDEKLFICDGTSGLKVYDKTNIENLKLLNHYKDINTFDVIPLENNLLMIGDKVLYQYIYEDNNIELISTFNLQ
jgi:hypothetical protein